MFVVCLIAMHLWRINNNTNNTTYNIKLRVTKYFYIKNSENNTLYILYIRKRWILNKKKKKEIFKEIIVQSEGLTQNFLDNKAPRKYYWRLKMHRVEWTKGKSRNRILKTFQFQRKISP